MKTTYLALVVLLVLLSGCSVLHSRSDSVFVTEIEGIYHVRFISTGNYYLPLTPEGPFPPWSDVSTFYTTGEGENDGRGGILFVIGKNVESQHAKYDEGRLTIRDREGEVQLDARLSEDYKDLTNHTGSYPCTIERPAVIAIEQFLNQEAMVNKYIKAVGRFRHDEFISGPYVFSDQQVDYVAGTNRHCEPDYDYTVIGLVQKNRSGGGYEIRLFSAIPIEQTYPKLQLPPDDS